jgi:hypothetical protein
MKANYWKWAALVLASIVAWQAYSGRSVSAQYGVRITKLAGMELMNGPINVSGEIRGFSCVSDVSGDLDKGDGSISSDVQCYVLSR